MRSMLIFMIILLISLNSGMLYSSNKKIPKYKNPQFTTDKRVEDLLSRMSLKDKFWQLYMIPGDLSDGKDKYASGIFGFQVATQGSSGSEAGQMLEYSAGKAAGESAQQLNAIQKYFVEETRLGIPVIFFDEALHGLVRTGATAYPQAIGLAATWDTELMNEVSTSIARECKRRGIRQVLSPVINIARDVRWGRTEETYGEDPFLTSQMAVAYVRNFEKAGIVTTPKHFAANFGDGGRDSYPIHYNERLLEEVYFPAFKASIKEGKSRSVMTSYNSLDGRQCTANDWLLNQKLKQEWNFDGFVISDAGATGGANVLHFTAKDYTESTQQAISDGLDVIFQTSYQHYPLFWDAFEKGLIRDDDIDNAVRRVLRAKLELGLFEQPYVIVQDNTADLANDKAIARKAAQESIVLLKNENQLLPLNKDIRSIAVIGTDAVEARLGGYSGPGNSPVSTLQGLQNKLGKDCRIDYAPGCGRESEEFVPIPSNNLFHSEKGQNIPGLSAAYFNNISLQGEPALSRLDDKIDFGWTLFSPDQAKINYDFYSARWTGKIIPDKSGECEIGIYGDDGYRLYLDGKLIIDNWQKQTCRRITKPYHFEQGKVYDLRVEFYETVGNVRFKLIWNLGVKQLWQQQISEAVQLAAKSEVAIVVAGIEEGEFRDRASLSLPGHQEEMIRQISDTGKPVVVILVGGSAVTMQNWYEHAPAILDVWYPGEEGGNAVADVLLGDCNPAGRLPITFPVSEAQLPLYYNHKPTGRGDDYLNLTGKPLFPFGFGLSYTSFTYSDLKVEKPSIAPDESTVVSFTLTNSGKRDGDEVVQLYIRDLFASVARPIQELKGFQRIHLNKCESKEVRFLITPELLSMLNEEMQTVVEPGDFRIMLGAASNDIRLRGNVTVKEKNRKK